MSEKIIKVGVEVRVADLEERVGDLERELVMAKTCMQQCLGTLKLINNIITEKRSESNE